MSEAMLAAIGSWCWPELATTDLETAKAYYSSLLGWEPFDVPSAEGTYTIFRLGGRDCGAAYRMSAEQQGRGLRPQWRNYVKVGSVDAAAARLTELGGSVVAGPFDVESVGRMASVQDPAGVGFALWQDGGHAGVAVQGAHGAHCWTERMTRNPAAAIEFYTRLCGWEARTKEDFGFPYTEFYLGEVPVGGLMPMAGPEWEGVPEHFMQYFQVDDCEATAARAAGLGGHICVPPSDVPGVGRFSVLDDPQGATFSVIQLAMP